jgi:hypothetical protein
MNKKAKLLSTNIEYYKLHFVSQVYKKNKVKIEKTIKYKIAFIIYKNTTKDIYKSLIILILGCLYNKACC